VVEAIDDDDSAHRAALRKASSLSASDYQSFRHRLGEYLKRRGFSHTVINHTVERMWQKQEGNGLKSENG
jgi:SOS response regulatory protein OraA/RecX